MIELVADAIIPHGSIAGEFDTNLANADGPSPALQSYYQIHELFVLLDACDRQVLDQYGLIASQYRLLMNLDPGSGQRLTSLSDQLLMSKSTITRIVDQLEERGWVQRVPDLDDRRALQVVLTEAGSQIRAAAAERHRLALEQRFGCLQPDEQEQFHALLGRLCTCLTGTLNSAGGGTVPASP